MHGNRQANRLEAQGRLEAQVEEKEVENCRLRNEVVESERRLGCLEDSKVRRLEVEVSRQFWNKEM